MAMFRQSALTFTVAQTRVAESAGASGSADLLAKAGYAVQTAIEHWANSHNWSYMLTTNTGITVVAPFTISACVTNSTTTVTSLALFGSVVVGDLVTGSGIEPETTVTVVTSTSNITLSVAATTSVNPNSLTFSRRDYALPAGFKYMYNARLVDNPRILYPIDTRLYDRVRFDQTGASTPTHYSLYPKGTDGKLRLLPTPAAADTLVLKYYRKSDKPSAGSDILDIPIDYEFYIIGLAKAFFLADKGGEEARQKFWWDYAMSGLRQARADDNRAPDGDEGFVPGSVIQYPYNPNSVTQFLGDY